MKLSGGGVVMVVFNVILILFGIVVPVVTWGNLVYLLLIPASVLGVLIGTTTSMGRKDVPGLWNDLDERSNIYRA